MYSTGLGVILSSSAFAKEIINNLSDKKEKKEKVLNFIKDNIGFCEFKGTTDAYWKDLETKETTVMILSIPEGTFITTPDEPKEEYSAEDVNGNFLILKGLLYKSNISTQSIIYMKV